MSLGKLHCNWKMSAIGYYNNCTDFVYACNLLVLYFLLIGHCNNYTNKCGLGYTQAFI